MSGMLAAHFASNILLELEKINHPVWLWLCQHFSKPRSIQANNNRWKDENIVFESERTSSMSVKMEKFQVSSKVSSSYQIPCYQNNTTSKLNT